LSYLLYQKLIIDYISYIVKKIIYRKERASMFSLSKIKNKKSFFLHIILLASFSARCYGMEKKQLFNVTEQGQAFSPKGGTRVIPVRKLQDTNLYFHYEDDKIPLSDGSSGQNVWWDFGVKIGGYCAVLVPIFLPFIVEEYRKWREDPEMKQLTKEHLAIDLKVKQHPDYPKIEIMHKESEAIEKKIEAMHKESEAIEKINKKGELENKLTAQQLMFMKHYEDKIAYYKTECVKDDFDRNFCKHAYDAYVAQFKKKFNTN
jgi:hypothetical protein